MEKLNMFQCLLFQSRKFESFAEFIFAILCFLRNFPVLGQIRKNKFRKT